LKRYLETNFKIGYIRLLTLLAGYLVLFVLKKPIVKRVNGEEPISIAIDLVVTRLAK
jgi:hypothetical protein